MFVLRTRRCCCGAFRNDRQTMLGLHFLVTILVAQLLTGWLGSPMVNAQTILGVVESQSAQPVWIDGGYSVSNSWGDPLAGGRIIAIDGIPVERSVAVPNDHGPSRTASEATPTHSSVAVAGPATRAACEPRFVDQSRFEVRQKTALFLTHFSQRLDTHLVTKPGLTRLVELAKQSKLPHLYLHEPYTASSIYFYPACDPDAYVESSIGFFEFASAKLEHAIVAGGFYEMCLNNTVTQLIRNWNQARIGEREVVITYVTDAVYCVAQDRHFADPFDGPLSAFIQQQPSTTVLLSDVLGQLPERAHAWTFLSRRWREVPMEWGLSIQLRDELTTVRAAQRGQPTLKIRYVSTAGLKLERDAAQALEPKREGSTSSKP